MEENEKSHSERKLVCPIPIPIHTSKKMSDFRNAGALFSSFVSLYILILLYFPRLIFSPVLLITLTLLIALLRFGATQPAKESNCTNLIRAAADHDYDYDQTAPTTATSPYSDQDHIWVTCKDSNFSPDPCFEDLFVEWNVGAPLEVIYEAYEGEAEEEENVKDRRDREDITKDPFFIERYAYLSLYSPESDSDSSSDGGNFWKVGDLGSPDSACFRWEDEDEDREELIEIALDKTCSNNYDNNKEERMCFENFQGEEENNLIEINISPARDEQKW